MGILKPDQANSLTHEVKMFNLHTLIPSLNYAWGSETTEMFDSLFNHVGVNKRAATDRRRDITWRLYRLHQQSDGCA
jgi:hypothetical protein